MKLKQNRTLSFIIIFLIYCLATAVGYFSFKLLTFSWWLNLLLADIFATVIVFIFSVIFKNASVYDPYWSVQPIVIMIFFAIGKPLNALRILLLISVCLWGLRLTANWAYTFKNLTHQDWRYTMLKEKTGVFYPIINFVGIHLVPTLVVYFCTTPVVYAFLFNSTINTFAVIGFIISLLAVTLQGVSDCQMHAYRKNKTTPFIETGLWKYSRHPNYLGEILMWWGVFVTVFACFTNVYLLALGALLNTILFVFVSIPLAEGKQSKKEGYKEYKNRTRALLPIKKFFHN